METKTIRLLGEEFQRVRWVDPPERLSLLASGQAEKVYRDPQGNLSVDPTAGREDGTIKLKTYAPEESSALPGTERESPTSLTKADAFNNAVGTVDTPKRGLVYRLREDSDDPKAYPAAIRCYGHDKADKPNRELVGNGIDRSMSRVEQWAAASSGNRSVTVLPGSVHGLTELELDPVSGFVL